MSRANVLPRILLSLLALIAVSTAFPSTVAAQEQECSAPETWGDCFLRLTGLDGGPTPPRETQKAIANGEAEEIVEAKTTSDATAGGAASLTSFLPRAIASLGFGELSEEDGTQTLTFNLRAAGRRGEAPDQWTLSLVRRDAEPLEALVMAIPEEIRAARKTTLEDDIEGFDDVEVQLNWALEGDMLGTSFGRSFAAYAATSNAVFEAVAPRTLNDETDAARVLLATLASVDGVDPFTKVSKTQELLASKKAELETVKTEHNLIRLGVVDEAKLRAAGELPDGESLTSRREMLEEKIERLPREIAQLEGIEPAVLEAVAAEKKAIASFQTELRDADYFRFADLVNNQPQLHFEGHYRQRDPVVGPDEWGLELTYEHGFGNVNSLRRVCGDRPDATCYQDYFKDHAVKSANRLTFSAEYGRTEDLRFELPDDDFVFTLDEIRKTIFKAAYGRTLLLDDEGDDAARVDLEGSYEDVSDDPMRRSRGLVTLTYTQNLIDNNTLSLSVVWANKPEYRGEVDHEWSARAGLKVKIDKKK